jgi:hypothetical protein
MLLLIVIMAARALAQAEPVEPSAATVPPVQEDILPAGEEVLEFEEPVNVIKVTPIVPEQPAKPFNAVKLRGLNKVTARISTLDAPLGAIARFGNLEIIARKCWQAPPEEQPENAALLQIRELRPGEGPQDIFNGWMFASSPALSALEHPVYDITVLSCEVVENE